MRSAFYVASCFLALGLLTAASAQRPVDGRYAVLLRVAAPQGELAESVVQEALGGVAGVESVSFFHEENAALADYSRGVVPSEAAIRAALAETPVALSGLVKLPPLRMIGSILPQRGQLALFVHAQVEDQVYLLMDPQKRGQLVDTRTGEPALGEELLAQLAALVREGTWDDARGGPIEHPSNVMVTGRIHPFTDWPVALVVDDVQANIPDLDWGRDVPPANLLALSDFEGASEARGVHPLIGEYRQPQDAGWALDAEKSFHGSQSLRIEGDEPFYWQTYHHDAEDFVFSVHLLGDRFHQEVEIGLETLSFHNEGGLRVEGRRVATVRARPEWVRHELPLSKELVKHSAVRRAYEQGSRQLSRMWVRPVGGGPVWVDAVQFERARRQASPYRPERGGHELNAPQLLGKRPGIEDPARGLAVQSGDVPGVLASARSRRQTCGPEETPSHEGRQGGSGRVALAVRETAALDRVDEPVRGGVAFPPGELFDASAVRLADERGRPVPAQTRPLARRTRDGSVISLEVAFRTSVQANASQEYSLEYGTTPTGTAEGLARETDDAIYIDTGAARLRIPKASFRWFDEMESGAGRVEARSGEAGSYVVALDGETFSSEWGRPEEVRIEQNGPERATVYVRGKHFSEDGLRTLLHYEARIHAFADSASLRLEHSFTQQEPRLNQAVQAVHFRLPSVEGPAIRGQFGLKDGRNLAFDGTAPVLLTQTQEMFGAGEYGLRLDGAGARSLVMPGERAAGWVASNGAVLAVEDFWRLHPKALEARLGSLGVHHWPTRHVQFVDLPFGVSNHLRMAYAPLGGAGAAAGGEDGSLAVQGADGATLGAEPLLLQADPAWMARTGVFGRYITSAEAAEEFPRYERMLAEFFTLMPEQEEAQDLTGMWQFGEQGTPRRGGNNEHTVARNLWLQYLRTNDPALFRRAWTMTRHIREVDMCHAGPGSALQHHHWGWTHTPYGFHMGHFWPTGMLWHYLLTGDSRSGDVARAAGALPIIKSRNKHFAGRNKTRSLYHLAELYECFGLRRAREAFEYQAEFGIPFSASRYHGGKVIRALVRWQEATGDETYLPALRDQERRLYESARGRSPGVSGSGREWTLFGASAWAARALGNDRLVRELREAFLWHMMSQDTSGHNIVRGSEYLYAAREAGLMEHPGMPDYLLDFRLFTGATNHYDLLVLPPETGPLTLKFYRMERGPVSFRVQKAEGQTLAEGTLPQQRDPQWEAVEIAADDFGGAPLRVSMSGSGQARFAFSANVPTIFISAEQNYSIRRGRADTSFYRFGVVPAADAEELVLRVPRWPSGSSLWGSVFAVRLEGPAGETLAHSRWVPPLEPRYPSVDEAPWLAPSEFRLPVPAEHRGRPLTLKLFAPLRPFAWRVEGVSPPWLARDAEQAEALLK